MTITSDDNRIQYNGNGIADTFSTGVIKFYDSSDLVVKTTTISTGVDDATLVLTTDYTVSGGDGATGSVTLVAGPLSSLKRITIERAIPYTQTIEFVEGENILASVVEEAFDRSVVLAQQLKDAVDRSLKVSSTSTATDVTFPNFSSGKILTWSSTSEIGNTNFTENDVQGAIDGVAALAAGSGVKVTSSDTTVGFLNGKLLAGSSIGFTVGSPGGNETLTVAVNNARLLDIATNLSATSGTVEKTAANTFGTYTVTSFAKTLLDDADAAAARVTLGTPSNVVVAHKNDTQSVSTSAFTDVTGLSASITPSSASNRIKVTITISIGIDAATDNACYIKLIRGSTSIGEGASDGGSRVECLASATANNGNAIQTTTIVYIDSPASASSTTYQVQIAASNSGDVHVNRSHNDTNATTISRTSSSLILEEIGPP